jgi:tetratricopeptide (TPR) repeat protein
MKKKLPHSASPSPVLPRRRLLFAGFTLVAFVVLMIVFEIALRLLHYGHDLELVYTTTRNGKEYCYLNPAVGKRYFDPKRYALPKVENGYFLLDKPVDGIRIFCLGASTTAGFPYEYNATPSRMLQKRLELAFPGKTIEVINAGLTATNSYTVFEFARELAHYQPDAFVVYSGQNEFYGALGVGSTLSAGSNGAVVRFYLALRRVKIFLLLEEALSDIIGRIALDQTPTDGTLMQQMAAEKAIPIGGPLYKSACEAYRRNLQNLAALSAENNIPLILSTLVTNERGLPPFVSLFQTQTGEKQREEVTRLVTESTNLLGSQRVEPAKAVLRSAVGLDSSYALVWYRLGQCYDALAFYDSASLMYDKARDCDGLRFRAPSEFNRIVRSVAANSNIVLADVDSAFRAHSPQGIIGNELLWEHVHPRLQGYILLSRVWCDALMNTALGGKSGRQHTILSDSTLYGALRLTNLDEAFGRQKMERLMNRWPFVPSGKSTPAIPSDDTERVAQLFLDGRLRWNEAHYEMADVFLKKRDFSGAAREYEAVSEFCREDPFPLVREGDMYAALEQFENAANAYRHVIALSDNQFIQLKIGVVLIRMNQPRRALEHLTRSVELDANASTKFSRPQKSEAAYYYALALSQIGNKTESIQVLSMILAQNPNDERAGRLLGEVRRR